MAQWVKYVIFALILATIAGLVKEFGNSLIPNHDLSNLSSIPETGAIIFGVFGVVIIALFLVKKKRH